VAKSGRSVCRRCSEKISNGEIRFGVPTRDSRGEYGYISCWQHLQCTRVLEQQDDLRKEIYGLEQFETDVQNQIIVEITKKDHPEHLEMLNSDDLVRRGKLPEGEVPPSLQQTLLPFQKEGLLWMIHQEEGQHRGGILADEMGMGKTIQTIALILSRRSPKPTLVVCPVSSMLQWEDEIRRHVSVGTLNVYICEKSKKIVPHEFETADVVLTTYAMLELSWRGLINEGKIPCEYCGQLFLPRKLRVHNKYYCGPKAKMTVRQQKQERRLQSAKTIKKGLRTLHVDVDDVLESLEDAPQQSTKSDSIAGPMGLYRELMQEAGRKVLSRWKRKRHGSASSSSSESPDLEDVSTDEQGIDDPIYNGSHRCDLCNFPILRYQFCPRSGQLHILNPELQHEIEQDTGGDRIDIFRSPLHSIKWFRIVLDEAHRIKSRTTSTSRAAFALAAEHKWCLTGTPLQNRVGDLYSLLRFMRIVPFAKYFCAVDGCSCSTFSHPFSGKSLRECVYCGHGPIVHYSFFNKHIMNPINRYGYVGDGRKAMMLLSNSILFQLMLRRTKAERADEMRLPPLKIEMRSIDLTPPERDFYESLYKKCTAQFDTYVAKGTILHNYAHIFQLLSRLRQALDHPWLVTQKLDNERSSNGLCGLCQERIDEECIALNPCRHAFHRLCFAQFAESQPCVDHNCPVCFVKVNIDLRQLFSTMDDENNFVSAAPPPDMPDAATEGSPRGAKRGSGETDILHWADTSKPLVGTKLDAIVKYIQSVSCDEKVIVFSQFGCMLDLIRHWLQRNSVRCVKLVGTMMLTQREASLHAFRTDPSIKVILISLKAGGEGLNIQVANHVILTDPWWNPAVELQAIQRAHRIGQTREVKAVRFVTKDSVEERMIHLQGKKMLVFEGTVDGNLKALMQLSEEDLQFLFTRN
jgi:DNA repair protein RAD16